MIRNLYSAMKGKGTGTKILILSAVMLSFASVSFAQVQITGKVTDGRGGELPGVTIVDRQNPSVGTTTNARGEYVINVPTRETELTFSYIGYKTQGVTVGTRTVINVSLEEDVAGIERVIVTGYGTQKKEFLVGSVAQVGAKELVTAPASNVTQMMVGKLPGITTVQRSGIPGGDNVSISVRGTGTPLILVDGVERILQNVNPHDIENISILKDASTAAVYGDKAAGGVILITTKQGREGDARITYNTSFTFTKNTAFPEFLNAQDYLYWFNKGYQLDGFDTPYYDADIQSKVLNGDPNGIYGQTDWFDLIFKNFGFTQDHNVSVTGGTEKTKYYTSLGLNDQHGIVKNTSYRRYNVRNNVQTKIGKNINFQMNLGGWFEDRNWPGTDVTPRAYANPIEQAVLAAPIINPTTPDGEWLAWSENGKTNNPLAALSNGYKKYKRWAFEGNTRLDYDFNSIKPLQGLKAFVDVSYDYANVMDTHYSEAYEVWAYYYQTKKLSEKMVSADGVSKIGAFTKSPSYRHQLLVRPGLQYARDFGKHSVSGLFLYEQKQSYDNTSTMNKQGYYTPYPVEISLGDTYPEEGDIMTGSFAHAASRSYVGQLNYVYDSRYIVDLTFRADGSYIFDPDNRWGFFPGAALGWVVSNEQFFPESGKIDFLKLKASIGELGANKVDPYLWRRKFDVARNNYIFGGNLTNGYYTSDSSTSILTWQKIRKTNVGLETSLWNGLLGIEFEWFYEYSFDILEDYSGDPPSLGGNVPTKANSGREDNRGFEIVLRHNNVINNDWRINVTGTFSYRKPRVLSRAGANNNFYNRRVLGRNPGYMYGYNVLGFYQTQSDIDNSPASPSGTKRLGDLMYEDVNGDGRITNQDYVKIGNPVTPQMYFTLSIGAQWKGIYLNMLWQGAAKSSYQLSGYYEFDNKAMTNVDDQSTFTRPFYGKGNAPYYLVENAWTPENPNAKYPRLSALGNLNNGWPSSIWTKNGNYLRMKSLQLGYQLPAELLRNTGINNLEVYFAGYNLLTLSSFKYVDPEMPSVQNGYYPQQKTFSLGLNITF